MKTIAGVDSQVEVIGSVVERTTGPIKRAFDFNLLRRCVLDTNGDRAFDAATLAHLLLVRHTVSGAVCRPDSSGERCVRLPRETSQYRTRSR